MSESWRLSAVDGLIALLALRRAKCSSSSAAVSIRRAVVALGETFGLLRRE